MEADQKTVTLLIHRLAEGDAEAAGELWQVVYSELHGLASRHMAKEGADATLQPTALVNEAWMRFAELEGLRLESRPQFFVLASKIMRSVLVDAARARKTLKRGGERPAPLTVDVAAPEGSEGSGCVDYLALDEALVRLGERDPQLARLVEMRFFAGLTEERCAEALDLSLRTVQRKWHLARVWLHGALREG